MGHVKVSTILEANFSGKPTATPAPSGDAGPEPNPGGPEGAGNGLRPANPAAVAAPSDGSAMIGIGGAECGDGAAAAAKRG